MTPEQVNLVNDARGAIGAAQSNLGLALSMNKKPNYVMSIIIGIPILIILVLCFEP